MGEDRKPGEDVREGLNLLLRAATNAAKEVAEVTKDATKEVDWGKLTREASRAAEQAGKELVRIANLFGRAFEQEIGVTSKSSPPPPGEAPSEAPRVGQDVDKAPAGAQRESADPPSGGS